jgi:UDP-N-acetylglucosamine--N-acetylmuramyl-(pentapeptide) pyrophosphoryl-undecaprenol N-acetylglucosamine transferase
MPESSKTQVLIAAGGSGGHLLPSKQLAEMIKTKGYPSPIFMGNGFKKASYWTDSGFKVIEVPSASIRKKNPFALLRSLVSLLKGTWMSLGILRNQKVDVVVGFGSFHSFPVLLAAKLLRIPLVLFEANCVLGKVNAFFAKRCKALAVQFPVLNQHKYPYAWVERLPWIKPPVKQEAAKARRELGLKEGVTTLLVFGGSQGASFINQLMAEAAKEWAKKRDFQIIHLTGKEESALELKSHYESLQIPHYVRSFEKDMPKMFAAADFAICRSGASTVAELIYFEKPAFLIPYPYAAENHQEVNARFFVDEVKGGIYTAQKNLNLSLFLKSVDQMLHFSPKIADFKKSEQGKIKKDLLSLVLEAP